MKLFNVGPLTTLQDLAVAIRSIVNDLNNMLGLWQTSDVVWPGGSLGVGEQTVISVPMQKAAVGDVVLTAANDTRLDATGRVDVNGVVTVTLTALIGGTFSNVGVKVRVWQ
jgi:hypothetical protein